MIELGESREDSKPSPLYNNNQGAIAWTKAQLVTSKKTRHLNIRELAVLEAQLEGEVDIKYVPGSLNPANLFTKEHKDNAHYEVLRDIMVPEPWPAEQREGCLEITLAWLAVEKMEKHSGNESAKAMSGTMGAPQIIVE